MQDYTLTTGSDTVVALGSGANVYGTAATLNAGDSLIGGTGTDVLNLVGSGTFRVDQLAAFAGFERIVLSSPTNGGAQLTLGNSPIEVDVTGNLTMMVYTPSNWNGNDVIKGDVALGYSTTSLQFFSNWGYPQSDATYDLTANTFSKIGTIYGNGDNLTLSVNSADTANIQSFFGFSQNDRLATSSSALDLSHTTVSGFTVVSTNSTGTTFTVGDIGTAFQIAGGTGHDTLVAQGFTLTANQRAQIFNTSSIETIIDASGTYPPPSEAFQFMFLCSFDAVSTGGSSWELHDGSPAFGINFVSTAAATASDTISNGSSDSGTHLSVSSRRGPQGWR